MLYPKGLPRKAKNKDRCNLFKWWHKGDFKALYVLHCNYEVLKEEVLLRENVYTTFNLKYLFHISFRLNKCVLSFKQKILNSTS